MVNGLVGVFMYLCFVCICRWCLGFRGFGEIFGIDVKDFLWIVWFFLWRGKVY